MNSPLHWIEFNIFVLIAVALDLGVFHRKAHKIGMREALLWSAIWIGAAVVFAVGVYHFYGTQKALEFSTGYLIEKSLSVDNLFVFLVLFRRFGVRPEFQHRVLAWGILGALIMRGAMIAAGAALIERFAWILYVFGAFLIYAAIHMVVAGEGETHPEKNAIVRFLANHLRMTKTFSGEKFFVRENGVLYATPLFLVLLVVEVTDVTFAVDSIPAVFGITRDAFVVYTSNVFAILGLRTLYFLLAGVLDRLTYIKYGLAAVLAFVGAKMLIEPWLHISVLWSLGIVIGILGVATVASLVAKPKKIA
ncbi:MAG: TerC family protein [Acidobacteria bacterium]|nr:TerC family protein [Acidobacteriota bacterium]MBS1865324.1 TerC family protein [Acidobacteriota bacterium]